MTKWEYKRAIHSDAFHFIWLDGICNDVHITTLDDLGKDGWEMVNFCEGWIIFKRPISND